MDSRTTDGRMNPVVKAQWLDALRSGKFEQGKEQLRTAKQDEPDEFCCLGVLAQVLACPPPKWTQSFLQGPVCELAGLPEAPEKTTELESDHVQAQLARMNDGGKSFGEIADWIEEHL